MAKSILFEDVPGVLCPAITQDVVEYVAWGYQYVPLRGLNTPEAELAAAVSQLYMLWNNKVCVVASWERVSNTGSVALAGLHLAPW